MPRWLPAQFEQLGLSLVEASGDTGEILRRLEDVAKPDDADLLLHVNTELSPVELQVLSSLFRTVATARRGVRPPKAACAPSPRCRNWKAAPYQPVHGLRMNALRRPARRSAEVHRLVEGLGIPLAVVRMRLQPQIRWPGKRLVDLGSEISPMPWFLATLGARVTLIEADPQWVPRWEELRARLGVDVDWHLVDSERLPLADAAADVLTSFSVIEHQPDKGRAMDEVARVLKPGGRLAISFDICEPDQGMTFPEWNGRALTLAEFEEFVWRHPAFDGGPPPDWNVADMPAFQRWNLQSAPHHNYVVGAAVLTRRA